MRRLSSYLFRAALVSTLSAVVSIFAVLSVWGAWQDARFAARLTPELRAEFESDAAVASPDLAAELDVYYNGFEQTLMLLVILLLGLLVGGAVGMLHGRPLIRPLNAVAKAAQVLARGRTDVRASTLPVRILEVDAFVQNFNAMADEIEAAERRMRDANAAVAHELRTPLTVLIGRVSGMLDGVFPADPEGLKLLLMQLEQMQRIVEDLNLLTMADAGQFRLNLTDLDLAEVIGQAISAEPAVTVDLAPAFARADAVRVRQVLMALLENARRHGGEGGIRIETAQEAGMATLRVMDRGPGLSPAQADRAFDPFWRAEPSRGRDTGGSGLGLSVVLALAAAQGGTAGYADRDGGGAVFSVSFPMLS